MSIESQIATKQDAMKTLAAEIYNLLQDKNQNKTLIEEKQAAGRQILQEIEDFKNQLAELEESDLEKALNDVMTGVEEYQYLEDLSKSYPEEVQTFVKTVLKNKLANRK